MDAPSARIRQPLPYRLTAEQVAMVCAGTGEPWVWFDGAGADGAAEARTSLFGIATEMRVAAPGREAAFLAELRTEPHAVPGAGLGTSGSSETVSNGFLSGWAVIFGYEFGLPLLRLPAAPPHPVIPHAAALRIPVVLAYSHETGELSLTGKPGDIRHWRSRWESLFAAAEEADSGVPGPRDLPGRPAPAFAHWRLSKPAYLDAVRESLERIREGEAYVICLTDIATLQTEIDPLDCMLALRRDGSALRGGLVRTAEWALVSASPERFLSIRGRRIATFPMKGTRSRAKEPARDAELADDLQHDPKERAENLMIVDLMRNDLSRVCAPGSVRVTSFLAVESHPHVHQLVSTVEGELHDGVDLADVLRAVFPGGSMTGAPKRRAVEILRELEPGPRGLYSGCFGWIDASGDAELAMTIRSVEFDVRAGLARVGAGGGLTSDSHPAREAAEKDVKAAPLLARLGAEVTASSA